MIGKSVSFDFICMFKKDLVHVNISMNWSPQDGLVTVLAGMRDFCLVLQEVSSMNRKRS